MMAADTIESSGARRERWTIARCSDGWRQWVKCQLKEELYV